MISRRGEGSKLLESTGGLMPALKPDNRLSGVRRDSSLPQWAVDKMRRGRGRDFAFADLCAARCALVVTDLMQNYIAGLPTEE